MNEASPESGQPVSLGQQAASRLPGDSGLSGLVFDRPRAASFWFTFLCALSVYLLTMPPHVSGGMGGLYSTGAYYAGVSHPPGYPLWTIYSHAFAVLVPFGNIAWRVALSSTVAGAFAAGLLASALCGLVESICGCFENNRRFAGIDEQWVKIVVSCVSALGLAFSTSFWKLAISQEPHAFGLMLFAATLWGFQRWFFGAASFVLLLGSVVAFGMAVSNTLWLLVAAPGLLVMIALRVPSLARDIALFVTFVLLSITIGDTLVIKLLKVESWVPRAVSQSLEIESLRATYIAGAIYTGVMCAILWIRTRKIFTEWSRALLTCIGFLLPFLSFLLLPVVSMTNPPVNHGYARTSEGFIHLIARGQFERLSPDYRLFALLKKTGRILPEFMRGYGWLFAVPAMLPFVRLSDVKSPARAWILGLLAPIFCLTFVFLALLNPSLNPDPVYIVAMFSSPAYILMSFWTAAGLSILARRLACVRKREPETRV